MRSKLLTLVAATLLAGCYKTDFYAPIIPDWGSVDANVPSIPDDDEDTDSYVLVIEGIEVPFTDGKADIPSSLSEGTYTAYVYNDPESIDVALNDEGMIIASVASVDGVVENTPSTLYFGSEEVTISKGEVTTSTLALEQITRDLYFEISLDGDTIDLIEGVYTSLSGVAQSWCCITYTPYGESASIEPTLEIISSPKALLTRADESQMLYGVVHLLGVSDVDEQMLTVEIDFKDGNPSKQSYTSDVSEQLADFNADKSTAMTMTATLTTPTPSSSTGSISDWSVTTEDVIVK